MPGLLSDLRKLGLPLYSLSKCMPPGLSVFQPHSDAVQVLPLKISFACPCWGTAVRPGCLLTPDQKLFKTPSHWVFASSRTTKDLFSSNACGVSLTSKTLIYPRPFPATALQIFTIQTIFPSLCFSQILQPWAV